MSEAAVEALGGAIGSCIAYGITYPINTISIWRSLSQQEQQEHTARWLSFVPSFVKELLQHTTSRGLGPLYAGIKPFLVATAVSNGLYFYVYSAIRTAIVTARAQAAKGTVLQQGSSMRSTDIGVAGSLLVASLAGCINVAVTHPIWLVSLRQQAARSKPSSNALEGEHNTADEGSSTWAVVRQVYQDKGIRGFWQGLTPALIMVVNPTVQYILYEWLTARLLETRRKVAKKSASRTTVALGPQDAFLLSAVAKLGATLVTYPMLLVKSRMQNGGAAAMHDQYTGVIDAIERIMQNEGFRGLFKGMQAKMAQTVLGAALLMGIKEHVYNSIRALQVARRQSAMLAAR